MNITKIQYDKVQLVRTYLKDASKLYFRNKERTRSKLNMNTGELRKIVSILEEEGILCKYSTSSTFTYKVKLDLL